MDLRARAAADLLAVHWHYARRGRSLATAALAGAQRYVEWAHHPREDHVDAASGVRFYYHAHAADERAPGEHGHFHVFVPAPGEAGAISHLAGISLDAQGLPRRLFTTNRWVTGERWQDADALAAWLPSLPLRASGPLAPVARWLAALLALYAREVEDLLRERDRRLAAGADLFEDRSLHVVSERAVSLAERLQRFEPLRHSPKEEIHVPCA